MATATSTSTRERRPASSRRRAQMPNLPPMRPEGEIPDPEWAMYRALNLRPDQAPDVRHTFPDISSFILARAQKRGGATLGRQEPWAETAGRGPEPPAFKARSFKDLVGYEAKRRLFSSPPLEIKDNDPMQRRQLFQDGDDDDYHPSLDPLPDEITDEWYNQATLDLFLRVHDFVSRNFGLYDLEKPQTSVWLEGLSREFIGLASLISRGDPVIANVPHDSSNWDRILLKKQERVFMVMGVIAEALDINVFGELLFGADEGQKAALDKTDEATLEDDGFQRTYNRSLLIKSMLGEDQVLPENFWPQVDHVTSRILALLLPLINLQGRLSPRHHWPRLTAIHQELHTIVSEAAVLTNMMRRSATVFRVDFPELGQFFDLGQEHLVDGVYNASRAAADAADEREYRAALKDYAALPEAARMLDGAETAPARRRRIAKVQIVTWPNIKRHRPLGRQLGRADAGERVSTVIKSQVVYYAGNGDDDFDEDERRTLHQHVADARRRRRTARLLTYGPVLLIIAFAFLMVLAANRDRYPQLLQEIRSLRHRRGSDGRPVLTGLKQSPGANVGNP